MYSFELDKKRVELQAYMRRVADLTSPNLSPLSGECRLDGRSNRSLPVLIVPCDKVFEGAKEAALAVSKDISDHGLSVLSCQPYPKVDVMVGLWLSNPHLEDQEAEPFFFRGHVRQNSEIGGGYWQIGIELTEVLSSRTITSALKPVAQRLLPRRVRREAALTPQAGRGPAV